MSYRVWFGVVLSATLVTSHFENTQNKLIVDTLSHLQISTCILFEHYDVETANTMKYLSQRGILSAVLAKEHLYYFLYYPLYFYKEVVVAHFDNLEFLTKEYYFPNISKYRWLVFFTGSWEDIGKLRIPYNCLFVLAHETSVGYDLYEVYNVKGKTFIQHYGNWSVTTGLNASDVFFYKRRFNLHGIHLIMMRFQEEMCTNRQECAGVELWYDMGKMMNFSTKTITPFKNPDTRADVLSQVSVYHASLLLKDPGVLKSIGPLWRVGMYLYVRHETDENTRWTAYWRPFGNWVWLTIALIGILSASILINIGYHPKETANPVTEFGFTPLDTLCNQCGAYIRNQLSHRWAIIALRSLAVVLIPSYSGSIISTLTLQLPRYPFMSLEEFVENKNYKLGSVNNTFGIGVFEYSLSPVYQKIATTYLEDQSTMPTSSAEGIRRVCEGEMTFLSPEVEISTWTKLPCRILKIPSPAFTTFAGMRLDFSSEFHGVFFYNVQTFRTSGILNKMGRKLKLTEITDPEVIEVTFRQIYPVHACIFIGVFLSLGILVLEKRMANQSRKMLKQTRNFPQRKKYIRKWVVYDGLWYS